MNPEIKAGVFRLIYNTFLHNADAIAYFVGIIVALGSLLRKPKRKHVLYLIAFVFLLARFEYLKHIVDPLFEQTQTTMIQEEGHYRAKRYLDIIFYDLVPLFLYLGGWGSLFAALMIEKSGQGKVESKSSETHQNASRSINKKLIATNK